MKELTRGLAFTSFTILLAGLFHTVAGLAAGCPAPSFTTTPALAYPAGDSARCVVAGDLNGDGIADLAVAHAGGISVLLGRGNGTFRAGTRLEVGDAYEIGRASWRGRGG